MYEFTVTKAICMNLAFLMFFTFLTYLSIWFQCSQQRYSLLERLIFQFFLNLGQDSLSSLSRFCSHTNKHLRFASGAVVPFAVAGGLLLPLSLVFLLLFSPPLAASDMRVSLGFRASPAEEPRLKQADVLSFW